MIRLLTLADASAITTLIQSNTKYYFTEKPDWFHSGMVDRNQRRMSLDANSVFIGYFDDNSTLMAYGRFTRWSPSVDTWSMNHISTLKGSGLPKTYGGKSADAVYDILNFATLLFEAEGRVEMRMMQSTDPSWENFTDNKHTLLNNYTIRLGETHKAGTTITPATGCTFLYYGDVITDIQTVIHRKKFDVPGLIVQTC